MNQDYYMVAYTIYDEFGGDFHQQTIVQGQAQLATLVSLFAKTSKDYTIKEVTNLGQVSNAKDLIDDLTKDSLPEDLDTGNLFN